MTWQNCAILEKWSQKGVNFKVYISIYTKPIARYSPETAYRKIM